MFLCSYSLLRCSELQARHRHQSADYDDAVHTVQEFSGQLSGLEGLRHSG